MRLAPFQKLITCLDGKQRVLTFYKGGKITYTNVKNNAMFGTSYGINTIDFPVTVQHDFSLNYNYKKQLPKWITKDMIIEVRSTVNYES